MGDEKSMLIIEGKTRVKVNNIFFGEIVNAQPLGHH